MAGVDIGGEGSSPSSSMGCPRALLELEKDLEVLLPLEVVATAPTIVTPAQLMCVEPLCECRCRLQPVPVWSQFTLPGRQLPFLAHFREQDTWTLKDEITGPKWQSIKCWIWESYPGQSDWVPPNSWSQCLMLRNPGTILAFCVWHSEDKCVFFWLFGRNQSNSVRHKETSYTSGTVTAISYWPGMHSCVLLPPRSLQDKYQSTGGVRTGFLALCLCYVPEGEEELV